MSNHSAASSNSSKASSRNRQRRLEQQVVLPGKLSRLEARFMVGWGLYARHLPMPIHDYRFLPARRWRWDFAWPGIKLAVEIHGGLYIRGHHSRGWGQEQDYEKYNTAVLHGWRVLVFGPRSLTNKCLQQTIETVASFFQPTL